MSESQEKSECQSETTSRHWLGLSVGSLLLAGVLAFLLVIGRMPPLDKVFTDPVFFKRALVVHVNLAIVVWFLGFFSSLWFLLPSQRKIGFHARFSPALAWTGLMLMVLSSFIPEVTPILSNYIPFLHHPLFIIGLALFGVSVLLPLLDWRMSPQSEHAHSFLPEAARPAIRFAGIAVLMAVFSLIASLLSTSHALSAEVYYEQLVWGAGHVLQFVSVLAMLAVWLILLTPVTGAPLSRRTAHVLFALLALPTFMAPIFGNTEMAGSRIFFTRLMQFGIFPIVSIVIVACLIAIVKASKTQKGVWKDARVMGMLVSALMTVAGFLIGASISGSNTMVPAHYHASIGAVTAAFMAVTYPLLAHFNMPLKKGLSSKLSAWQPVIYGLGQLVFAVGFGVAGLAGALRKTYGTEQAALGGTWLKTTGLVVMSLGGFVAIAGGLIYLWLLIALWRKRHSANSLSLPKDLQ